MREQDMNITTETARSIGTLAAHTGMAAATLRWVVRDLQVPVWIAVDLRELSELLDAAYDEHHAELSARTTGKLSFTAGHVSTRMTSLALAVVNDAAKAGHDADAARRASGYLTDAAISLAEARNTYLAAMGF